MSERQTNYRILFSALFIAAVSIPAVYGERGAPPSITAGMSRAELSTVYPKETVRCGRQQGAVETFTVLDGNRLLTFYLNEGRLDRWAWDDRKEVAREYLAEFASRAFTSDPKIHAALIDVLARLPKKDFIKLTDRDFPVVFTEYYTTGSARWANSAGIETLEQDAPTFRKGLWIVKLNVELAASPKKGMFEAIVAHELAHRILKDVTGKTIKDLERAANRLVIRWGFGKEFKSARLNWRKLGNQSA